METRKRKLIKLVMELGSFIANCDGEYDVRESEFIDKYIDYASDRAIVRHVGNYICDILEDLWEDGNIDGVIAFLKKKGYQVEKPSV